MTKEQIVPDSIDLSKQSMARRSAAFLGNDLSTLTSIFLRELFYKSDPSLLRKIVIYPTNDIKEFIVQEILESGRPLFGLRFLSLPQAIEYLTKITSLHPPTFPTHIPLTLHIEEELRNLIQTPSEITLPLIDYIENKESKLLHLSEKLGHVFLHYGLYGKDALLEWEREKGWQQLLWQKLKMRWDFPCALLNAPTALPFPLEIHLFHIQEIPALYKTYFDSLEQECSIRYYFLSPSPLYWGDLLKDRYVAKLDQKWERMGINIEERIYFSTLSKDVNPLLQNLSSLAQPMLDWLSEKPSMEAFTPPTGTTLLSSLKRAFYELTPFEDRLPIDDSVQIHEASSKLREVEILLHNLKTLYLKSPFGLEDVLVAAPNIESYTPYIQLLFANDPLFKSFVERKEDSPVLPLFFNFIDSRFEPPLLFKLLTHPSFQKKSPFSIEEIDFLHSIVEEKGVNWGFDPEMREELLNTSNLSPRGSWSFAFDSLIGSIPFSSSKIELSQMELLGEWIQFIQQLHKAISSFKKGSHTIIEWIERGTALLDTYFLPSDEVDSLKKELRRLFEVGSFVLGTFSYPSIRQIIEAHLEEKKTKSPFSLRFSNIQESSLPSVKILYVLGLDEESFPRNSLHLSLNQLKGRKGSDHQSEIGEKDRYFFIQTILSAKEHLIFSFVNRSPVDGKELYPSPLLKELPVQITKHPALPFSKEIVENTYFSEKDFQLSLAYYKKECPLPPIPKPTPKEGREVSISALLKLMKHPLQFFANEVAGIYFTSREEEKKKENSEFFLSYQERFSWALKGHRKGADEVLEEAHQNNSLPTALFKEVAETEIRERLKEIETHYHTLGVNKGEVFSLLLHQSQETLSFLTPEILVVPILQIPVGEETIAIYGKVDFLTKTGVILHGEESFEEIWKAIPTLLLSSYLFQNPSPTLFFAKSGTQKNLTIEDPLNALSSLLAYYKEARKAPSPLMPNRVEPLLKGDLEKFLSLVQKRDSFFEDPYLLQITPDMAPPWESLVKPLYKTIN